MSRKAKRALNIAAIAAFLGTVAGLLVAACGGSFPLEEIESVHQEARACTCDVVLPAAVPVFAPLAGDTDPNGTQWSAPANSSHLAYWKDPLGRTNLRGSAYSSSPENPISVLPVGYRPKVKRIFITPTESGPTMIIVQPNGEIIFDWPPAVGTWSTIWFDGISYLAEQ